jgi:hypothetical protein
MGDDHDHLVSRATPSVDERYHRALIGLASLLGAFTARLEAGLSALPCSVDDDEAVANFVRLFGSTRYSPDASAGVPCIPPHIEPLFGKVQALIRGDKDEERIWNLVIAYTWFPLPREIALDLVKRNLCSISLSHSWQHEEVWWQLVDIESEAAENLLYHRYVSPRFDANQLEEVFHQFPWWETMAPKLSKASPSHASKAAWLVTQLKNRGITASMSRRKNWHPVSAQAWDEVHA